MNPATPTTPAATQTGATSRPAGLVAAADLGSSVWEPLVEYRRNDVAENTIHGAVAWVSGRNSIHSFGGNVRCTAAR